MHAEVTPLTAQLSNGESLLLNVCSCYTEVHRVAAPVWAATWPFTVRLHTGCTHVSHDGIESCR